MKKAKAVTKNAVKSKRQTGAKRPGKPKQSSSAAAKGRQARLQASGQDLSMRALLRRIEMLEEAVDRLRGSQIHQDAHKRLQQHELSALLIAQDKFVRTTADGWLLVMISGARSSLPSGLKVSLTSTSGGRDAGTVLEGVLAGAAFDVSSGNLDASSRRLANLKMDVKRRAAGPVKIDGISYELELNISFSEGGTPKSIGPFAAKTDQTNPLPVGSHDVEIADFPHDLGEGYGPHGKVWFRIGHHGDRYVHPGRVSEGCLTCAPTQWEQIYPVLNNSRSDNISIGTLVVH
ncbi:hypothetical protein ACQR16_10045 [Bradyrhizobium oligotrophicum]|uniref:hypothetical protein n=1 Tax=Bradyrhizobium oligotrophicum TaxID=44255 RepID=UPI003EBE816A